MKKVIITIIILAALGCGAVAYAYESNSSNGGAESNNQIENNIGGQAQNQSTGNNNSSESNSNSTSSNQNNTSQNNTSQNNSESASSNNNQENSSSSNSKDFSDIYSQFYSSLLMFNKSPNFIPLQHDDVLGTYTLSKTVGSAQGADNKLIMTKDLYSYNGTTISNPDYYEVIDPFGYLTTSTKVSELVTGVPQGNTELVCIIAVPHGSSEETVSKIISNTLFKPSNFPCVGKNGLLIFNSLSSVSVYQ